MTKQHVTDAELVAFLKALRDHDGNGQEACRALGLSGGGASRWKRMAEDRGLSADSPVMTQEERLRIQVRGLQKDLDAAKREHDTAETIRRLIYELASYEPAPPKWLMKATGKGNRGIPMTLWSDWHYGEVVRPEEVGGVNEFNSEIAVARVKQLVETTIDLCKNHMGRSEAKYPGIVVCLGGDMITGDIHEELVETNDRTNQQAINELTDIIASALEVMAEEFGNVFVPCVVGNHGRATKKFRMKGRVYTSHEWNIYCNLERYFRKDKRVQFMIPGETDAYFKVHGHRFLLTHGDSLGVKGGDGIIGLLGPVARGAIKVGKSEAEVGRNIDVLLMGHWHTYLTLKGIIVNGSLKGYDEYARLALRAGYERPIQALWFVHPQHGITAHWPVYLDDLRSTGESQAEWITWRTA